jgi:ABC-type sugar transport system substrate-binding protein
MSVITVFHSPPNNAFSSVIANGVKQAEADYKCSGVTTQFIGTTNENDAPGAIQLIQAAIVKKPQGLVVTLPDPSAMETVIKQAVDAGIPVITYNSGIGVSESRRPVARRPGRDHRRARPWPASYFARRKERCLYQRRALQHRA